MTVSIRAARQSDAELLARLVNMAGEGMPLALWSAMADPGADPWAIGRSRAARDEGAFSWCNARIGALDGVAAGALVDYAIAATPDQPDPDTPPAFVPLIALEALAPETRYVNVLAVLPEARQRGLGRALLADALARPGPRGCSLIVASGNHAARALYRAAGFAETARRPLVALPGWTPASDAWVLMTRS